MSSSKSSTPLIHLKPVLTWIQKLEATKSTTIEKNSIFQTDFPMDLERSRSSFQFSFNYEKQFDLHKNLILGPFKENLHLSIDDKSYIAKNVFFGSHSLPTFSGSFDALYTKGYSESANYFYRMIIPLERELRFHYQLQEHFFNTDFGYSSRTGSLCRIQDNDLILAVFHDDEKNFFLCIESGIAQNFDTFSEKAFAARNALAYISGYYAGDSCYCFTYASKVMKKPQHLHFLSLRPTMKSHYNPINTNPYGRLYHLRGEAEKWQNAKCLRPVSIQEFSRLGELIYTSREFESAIILILESSVASLLFMPGGYAIALETIAPLIHPFKIKSLSLVSAKPLWKKIRKELLNVIIKYQGTDAGHNYQALEYKINNLNAPTNKSKLQAPFNHLQISLLPEDLTILETRNDFLHGRAPDLTNAGEGRTTKRLNSDLYYSSLRLYTLLNMLIMKWIGYDNYVLNYPKINESATGIPLNEDPYRKV